MEVGDILAVLAQSKDLVSVSDLGLDIVFVSEGARTILGYEPEAVLGKNGLEFFHPDDVGLFAAVVGQMTTDGYQPVAPTLYRLRHADGSFVTLELLGGGVEKAGIPLGFWMIGRQPRRSEVYATVLHALLDEQPQTSGNGRAAGFDHGPGLMV